MRCDKDQDCGQPNVHCAYPSCLRGQREHTPKPTLGQQIEELKAEVERLKKAVKELLGKRSATERVYDQSYDFAFKSWGSDEWFALEELSGWTEEEGHKWRTDNGYLMDDEEPFKVPLSVSFAEHMKEQNQ